MRLVQSRLYQSKSSGPTREAVLRAVLEGTGVAGVTPHSFRRTVATFLDRAGGADLAAEMLATTYGIEFDPDASWDEKREIWSIDNRIVRTRSVNQVATVGENGSWTTTVAAAVLVL